MKGTDGHGGKNWKATPIVKETTGNKSASVTGYKDLAHKIVDEIIEDLMGRRGLKHEYRQCDPDIQEEIKDTWGQIIEDEMIKSL